MFTNVNFAQLISDEIIFFTNGSSFSPIITISGDALVQWTFQDSTTSSLLNPRKDYGSDGLRINKLKVTPWSALKGINIGYDASDGGSKSIPLVSDQKVSRIENLELVAPYLELWCSSYNMLDTLNFDNFINLNTVECFHSTTVQNVSLKNTPKLKRLCLEDNDLKTLDISDCINLEDLRAALNDFKDVEFSKSTDMLWHLCIRNNKAILNQSMFSNLADFPAIRELLIWDTNQSGIFAMHNTIGNSILLLAYQNEYTSLDLKGSLLNENGFAEVNFRDNRLNSVNLEGCKQITELNLSNNLLSADSVDHILKQLDDLGTSNRKVNLLGNSAPTSIGLIYKANLEAKGWIVNLDSIIGPSISIMGNNVSIINGDDSPSDIDFTNFGRLNIYSSKISQSFTIENLGTDTLRLLESYPYVLISDDNPTDFYISKAPSNIIAPGNSSDFIITFDPNTIGISLANVQIFSNDTHNNPYRFLIQGEGFLSEVNFNDGRSFYRNIKLNSVDQAFGRFELSSNDLGSFLNSVNIQLNGKRNGVSNFKLWISNDSTFNSIYDTQLGRTIPDDPGDNGFLSFYGFLENISNSSGYYFLTADFDSNSYGEIQGIIRKNEDIVISGGTIVSNIDSAILSNNNSLTFVELASIKNKISENFILYQNYPNPFNPITSISYQIPFTSLTILSIFDALGRELFSISNIKEPGIYEYKWNGSQYPSGVYIYKLKLLSLSNKDITYTETKKMILIK